MTISFVQTPVNVKSQRSRERKCAETGPSWRLHVTWYGFFSDMSPIPRGCCTLFTVNTTDGELSAMLQIRHQKPNLRHAKIWSNIFKSFLFIFLYFYFILFLFLQFFIFDFFNYLRIILSCFFFCLDRGMHKVNGDPLQPKCPGIYSHFSFTTSNRKESSFAEAFRGRRFSQ